MNRNTQPTTTEQERTIPFPAYWPTQDLGQLVALVTQSEHARLTRTVTR